MSDIEITPELLADLKCCAECIKPEHRQWFLNDYKRWVEVHDDYQVIVCHPEHISQALPFIAEANPAVVLALVDEIERLRKGQNK